MSNARDQRRARMRSAAAIASGLLLAGTLAAGAAVAAQASGTDGSSNVRVSLAYTCSFPVGTQHKKMHVGVTIAAIFPQAATTGRRIQPTRVQLTVGLPAAAVGAMRELGASSVSSTTLLSVEARQRTVTTTRWQGHSATAQPLPATGGLSVVAPGQAAPVTVASGRDVRFAAAGLTLALRLDGAASASPSPGSGSTGNGATASPTPASGSSAAPVSPSPGPAALRIACAPTSHRGTTLDAVKVAAASASSKSPANRHKRRLPKGCAHIKVTGNGVATCGYITGYADVVKLYGAALLQPRRPARPALVNLDFGERPVFKPGRLVEYSTAELDYKGHRELPPVRATFLAFRFVPVTATLTTTELGPIRIRSVSGITAPPYPITVRATTRVRIRISDVDVNGVPLAIGPHCRPVSPARLTLIGRGDNTIPPRGYTVPTGGPLSGRLTIPAFTHCGVTENLDPLLTGSISGPGNFVQMTQGRLCGPSQPRNWTCPPPVPKPIH